MDKETHIITSIILSLFLVYEADEFRAAYIIVCMLAGYGPDLDIAFERSKKKVIQFLKIKHRNFLFHSGIFIIPMLWYESDSYLAMSISVMWGLHLLCDIRFKVVGGMYCIDFFGKKLNYRWSTTWLAANGTFLICLGSVLAYV